MSLAINIVLGANTAQFNRNIQSATKKAETQLKGFAGVAQKALDRINIGTIVGAGALATVMQTADKMQSLASKIKLATDSAEQFALVQDKLRAIADEQRSSYEGVVDLYASSRRALAALGKSQQNVIDFTRNMTMAMNIGGGSAQAQAAALTQLGQALGSGALRGDEFNSVAEQAPILMDLIAKKMGVSSTKLKELAADGKITADVVYEAVAGSTKALEEMSDKMPPTMAAGFQVIKDNFGYLVHDITNGTNGISQAIAHTFTFIGRNLETLVTIAGIAGVAVGAKLAHQFVLAKLGADSLTGSLIAKTRAMMASTAASIRDAQFTASQINLTNIYQQRMIALSMTKRAYVAAVSQAVGSTVAYTRALLVKVTSIRASTTATMANVRATLTLANAQKVATTGAILAGRGIASIGGVLASVGRIIMAHPLMIIGGIIAAVIVRTMGLQKAMDSLSEAFSIAAEMLGQLIDFGVAGFESLWNTVGDFFQSFDGASNGTISAVSGYFGSFFETSHTGFVGVLHVAAKVFDGLQAVIVGTLKTAWQNFKAFFNGIRNGFAKAVNAITGAAAGIANAVGGVINQAIDGLNGLIDGAAKIAAKAGIDIGGRITYRASTNWQGKQIAVSADDTNLSWGENVKKSNWGIAEGAFNKAYQTVKNKKDNAKAQEGLNKALGAGTKANNDNAKATKGKANADKKAKKEADENAKAQQKLAEVIEKQELEWEKLRYEMAHPLNLELDKINWEIAFGELKDATDEQKAKLIEQAIAIDKDILADDFKKHINDVSESVANVGRDSHLDQFVANATNSWHKFSQIKDELYTANEHGEMLLDNTGKLSQVLNQMADADAAAFSKEMSRANDDIIKQLNLGLANNDLERKFLEFESEYNDVLDKYQSHAQMMDTTAYKQIEQDAQHNLALKRQLATVEAYRDVVAGLQDDESKKLKTLESQLAVIAEQHKLLQNPALPNKDGLNPIDIETARRGVLDQALGLPQAEQSEFAKLDAEYNNRLMTIKTYLDKQQQLYKDNAEQLLKIEEEGEQAKLRVRKLYEQQKTELLMATAGEQLGVATDGFKSAFGEQSRAYQAMFRLQQSWVIGSAILNIKKAISDAFANGVTWTDKLTQIALATSEGMKIITAIKQIRNPIVGQAHDGIMSVPKSGTWNLEKGERVLPKHTAQNLDKTLNRLQGNGNGGGVVINQTITVNSDGSSDVQTSTELGKRFGDAIKSAIQRELNNERRQGGLLYGR